MSSPLASPEAHRGVFPDLLLLRASCGEARAPESQSTSLQIPSPFVIGLHSGPGPSIVDGASGHAGASLGSGVVETG